MGAKAGIRLEAIRELLRGLIAAGETDKAIDQAMLIITEQAQRLDRLLRERYGVKSEKVSPEQLRLALAELARESEEQALPAAPAPSDEPASRPVKEKKPAVRRPLPPTLERIEHRHVPEGCTCEACGAAKVKIREERSEMLDYVPARLVVHVDIREVWACRCGDGKVVTAPAPPRVIDGGLPGPGLLTQVIVAKCCDHLPLHRQLKIFRRSGVDLAQSTMVDWMAAGAEILQPLARAILERVKHAHVIQADDTGIPVLSQDHEKGTRRGHIWALVGDARYVAYFYAPDWSSDHPLQHLAGRRGYLQVDGYKGYETILRKAPEAIRVGCYMHARRPFKQALDVGDVRAAPAVDLFAKIYQIEAESKEAGEDHEARKHRRAYQTKPLFAKLINWALDLEPNEPPKSHLGKALGYLTKRIEELMRVFDDGALELDNGAVERALRGLAVGRKNWLFAGSDSAAERAAILYTVLESAALHGLEPWAYVHDVLQRLAAGWPQKRLEELLPHRWTPAEAHQVRITKTPPSPPSSSSSENRSSAIHD
jgi:transposase